MDQPIQFPMANKMSASIDHKNDRYILLQIYYRDYIKTL
jgi:hypothetical protein